MLAFAPQAWTSDDTDAIERLRIQWGTSLPYPLSSMSAHVSAVPNHQVGRVTPLATRARWRSSASSATSSTDHTFGRGARRRSRSGRLLQAVARPAPARSVPAPSQSIRGRPRRNRLDDRGAGRPLGSRRSLSDPEPPEPGPQRCGCAVWTPRLPIASQPGLPPDRSRPARGYRSFLAETS